MGKVERKVVFPDKKLRQWPGRPGVRDGLFQALALHIVEESDQRGGVVSYLAHQVLLVGAEEVHHHLAARVNVARRGMEECRVGANILERFGRKVLHNAARTSWIFVEREYIHNVAKVRKQIYPGRRMNLDQVKELFIVRQARYIGSEHFPDHIAKLAAPLRRVDDHEDVAWCAGGPGQVFRVGPWIAGNEYNGQKQ